MRIFPRMETPGARRALQLLLVFGLVSLFGDIAYEGARGVNGAYLETLGASALLVGLIAGTGEFLGYGIRLVSGWLGDRTRAYWTLTILGYGCLISVPLMALSNGWQLAGLFIVLERVGKALRSPAKDTILSHAAAQVGRGFGFGLHEAMDQIGALIGPLLFALVLSQGSSPLAPQPSADTYRLGYALLAIPVALTIGAVLFARFRVPQVEPTETKAGQSEKLGPVFWTYLAFTFFTTLGFVNFALVAFHLLNQSIVPPFWIPIFYAIAMVIDGGAALLLGRLYDRLGLGVIVVLPLASAAAAPLLFSSQVGMIGGGLVLWGLVMGGHETIMKAAVADLTHLRKRGTGYGIFHTAYGLAALGGAVIAGALYGVGPGWIAPVLMAIQIPALALATALLRKSPRASDV